MSKRIEQAAARLSVAPKEIASAEDSPAGMVIVTTDGASYIDVPEDRPDADGKTGLMFLAAPKEGNGYAIPIFTPEPVPGEEEVEKTATTPEDIDLDHATAAEVVAWVGNDQERAAVALEAEQSRSRPRTGVLDHLSALTEGAGDEPGDDDA